MEREVTTVDEVFSGSHSICVLTLFPSRLNWNFCCKNIDRHKNRAGINRCWNELAFNIQLKLEMRVVLICNLSPSKYLGIIKTWLIKRCLYFALKFQRKSLDWCFLFYGEIRIFPYWTYHNLSWLKSNICHIKYSIVDIFISLNISM